MLIDLITGSDASAMLAYLDPGLGSMQLQILVAAILSASFYLKSSFAQAKSVVGRFWKKKD